MGILIFGILSDAGFALDTAVKINQYSHTVWRIRDNGLTGSPTSITQTSDGYIWLGTINGLFRFDGIRFTKWASPVGEHLPSDIILNLFGSSDGSLYIGTLRGLVRLRAEHLEALGGALWFPSQVVEDPQGRTWAAFGYSGPTSTICRINGSVLDCHGTKDGLGCVKGYSLAPDFHGSIWIGSEQGLCRWTEGKTPEFFPLAEMRSKTIVSPVVAVDRNGGLWAGVPKTGKDLGLLHFDQGAWHSYRTKDIDMRQVSVTALHADRAGALWIGTVDQGLRRLVGGRLDSFDDRNGLSGNSVSQIYEDHEGSLWVVTSKGVDLFHNMKVVTYSIAQGLSSDATLAVERGEGNSVWVGTDKGLDVLDSSDGVKVVHRKDLPASEAHRLFKDASGAIWIGAGNNLFVAYDNGGFEKLLTSSGKPFEYVVEITEDNAHDVWVSTLDLKTRQPILHRMKNYREVEALPSPGIAQGQTLNELAPDPKGGLWIAGYKSGLYKLKNGHFDSFDISGYQGRIEDLYTDFSGMLWVSTPSGYYVVRNGRAKLLSMRDGLPCNAAYRATEDRAHSIWLVMDCGYVQVARSQIDLWEQGSRKIVEPQTMDVYDGAQPVLTGGHPSISSDGRIWFVNYHGVQAIEPSKLPVNPYPPPVVIERLVVDRVIHSPSSTHRLKALTRDVEIDYSALSFVIPERVDFRYRLKGYEKDWVDAGTRRQAFYSNLSPGTYTFQLIASNNDGIWNDTGATLDFSIPPAWYQTLWFLAACAIAFAGLLWSLYRYRMLQLGRQFDLRLEERVGERTRIARDLHDTMLQSFQGSLFEFQAAQKLLSGRPEEARPALDRAIDSAKAAIAEGREAIQGLRSGPGDVESLCDLLKAVGNQFLDARSPAEDNPTFQVTVEGQPEFLQPVLQDELFRIGQEILRNAFRHGRAKRIEVEIRYSAREFRLGIRDDGIGIDPKVVDTGGCPGHWGLPGVRERAKLIGAEFELWSEAAAGTEIQITVPGSLAYMKSRRFGRLRLLRKGF